MHWWCVTVESRIGWFHDRVLVRGIEYEVHRGRGGWHGIVDVHQPTGRVRYDAWHDRVLIESPHGPLQIQFRWKNSTFVWHGRTYRISSMVWNRITIWDGDRPVVEGKVTWSGVRIERIEPPLSEIERELAVGIGLRALAIASAVIVPGPV